MAWRKMCWRWLSGNCLGCPFVGFIRFIRFFFLEGKVFCGGALNEWLGFFGSFLGRFLQGVGVILSVYYFCFVENILRFGYKYFWACAK